jgi:transcriptional regulator with XRE-family HTH domain
MERPPAPPEAVLIRLAREAANIRIADAAARAGVSVARWSQIEAGSELRHGSVSPVTGRAGTIARMAHVAGVSPERLAAEGARPDAAEILREIRHREDAGGPEDQDQRGAGAAVAARRGELGMTQRDLADAAGCDTKTVYNLESGTRWPIARTRSAISVALGWQPDALNTIAAGAGALPGLPGPAAIPGLGTPRSPDAPVGFISREMEEAARPFANAIWQRLILLAPSRAPGPGADLPDPGGAALFGGDSPDAGDWDRYGRRGLPVQERIWLVAALQAWNAARERETGTG